MVTARSEREAGMRAVLERLRAAGGLDRAVRIAEEVIAEELVEVQARAARPSCSNDERCPVGS